MLDIAEASLRATCDELQLRGTVLRKARACGLIPGGKAGKAKQPGGSGKSSLPREALDEACFRLQAELGAHCDAARTQGSSLGSSGFGADACRRGEAIRGEAPARFELRARHSSTP